MLYCTHCIYRTAFILVPRTYCTAGRLLGGYLVVTWWLLGGYLVVTWWLLGGLGRMLALLPLCSSATTLRIRRIQTPLWPLAVFPSISRVRSLDLGGCAVYDCDLTAISEAMQNLCVLGLMSSKVTEVDCLCAMALTRLDLRNCKGIADGAVALLAGRCTQLAWLDLSGCDVSDALFSFHWHSLSELRASIRSPQMGTALLSTWCCPQTILLANCSMMRSVLTKSLGSEAVDSLIHLNLSGCKTLREVRMKAPNLESLRCKGCAALTLLQLDCFREAGSASSVPCLVDIQDCGQLDRECVRQLQELDACGILELNGATQLQ